MSSTFETDPHRWFVCKQCGCKSAIESTDWTTLITAFKRAYCEGCPGRDPKIK